MPAPPFPRQTLRGLVTVNFHLCSRDRQRGKPGAPHRDLKDLPLPAQEGAFFRKPLRSPESLTRKNGPLPSSALCGGEPKPLFGIDASALNRLRLSLSVSPPLQISFASLKIVSRALRPSSTTFRVSARVHAKRIAASLSLLASRVGCPGSFSTARLAVTVSLRMEFVKGRGRTASDCGSLGKRWRSLA